MGCLIHVDGTEVYDKFCYTIPNPYNMYFLWGLLGVLVIYALYLMAVDLW